MLTFYVAPQEAEAARSISQRGVMLVATAHGTDLRSIMGNPDLNSLVGGMQVGVHFQEDIGTKMINLQPFAQPPAPTASIHATDCHPGRRSGRRRAGRCQDADGATRRAYLQVCLNVRTR